MRSNYLVLVCTSEDPKQNTICCKDRGSVALISAFRQELERQGLDEQVEVRSSGCLSNCRLGISVKVFPDNILYNRVSEPDLAEIVESHFIKRKPVDRLITSKTNRFLGF